MVEIEYYLEEFGGKRLDFGSFHPDSHPGPFHAPSHVFNNVPLEYDFAPNCGDVTHPNCTVSLWVAYDDESPANWMRSFDIYLPSIDFDKVNTYGIYDWDHIGFELAMIDVTALPVNS